jgi:hypothetical protein
MLSTTDLFYYIYIYIFFFCTDVDVDIPVIQVLSERVDRLAFNVGLTTVALALQQDYVLNQSRENKFQISGFRPSG